MIYDLEGSKEFEHILFRNGHYAYHNRKMDWSPDGTLLIVPAGMF